jgi:acetyltransferase
MTVRNLEIALSARSIALVGASERPGSVGRVVLENVLKAGFAGAIYPVNLKYQSVLGRPCFRTVADLPEAPDLAVLMTPPSTIPRLIGELGARGTKLGVVITAGVDQASGLRQQMLDAAQPHLLRIIGPNTIGLLAPHLGLNASFAHIAPTPGRIGLISQSGAIVSSVVDWAAAEGIGFSSVISLGDMADVDAGDALNLLAADEKTSAILMYLESIPAARKFMSAARAAARTKPLIAVKPGRHLQAAKAALTHTGALAGADRVVDAALRRAGIIRVNDLDDLFNAAEVTARYAPLRRGRVGIVTNGGGAGVLAVDQLLDAGCEIAELSPSTLTALDAALPANWSRANPVDIIGDAPPQRYGDALLAVAADPAVDVVLVMNCPTAIADPLAAARAVADLTQRGLIGGKPVLSCWLGKQAAEPARAVLQQVGVGTFDTPTQAAAALSLLTRWYRLRSSLERVPSVLEGARADAQAARAILTGAATEQRHVLTESEAKGVLRCYGINAPETVSADNEDGVAAAAARLLTEWPAVVVKMASKAVSHKSDSGGVVLDLRDTESARTAAAGIRQRFAVRYPDTALDGFAVQPMISRPDAFELICGVSIDAAFGPVIVVGAGGTAVEVLDDTATGLVPLDEALAGDLVDQTRIGRLLRGHRNRKPADRTAIINVLLALSRMAVELPMLRAIDINPLLVDSEGAIALDARIEIEPAEIARDGINPRLALHPYPQGWDDRVETGLGPLVVRPIRPTDAALYPRFLERMTPEDMRLRFLTAKRSLSRDELVRLTQLDYDRDIAFVALERDGALAGIARYASDPDRQRAEFGILVRSDLAGNGLGRALMGRLIAYAQAQGLGELFGLILPDNRAMLALCDELGFSVGTTTDAGLRRATLVLEPRPQTGPSDRT